MREPDALRCWNAFMAMLPGSPMLYAGQELAIGRDRGMHDRGEKHYHRERDNVPWDRGDAAFGEFMHAVLAHMHDIKRACRTCHVSEITRGVVRIDWRGGGRTATGIFNLENRHGSIPVAWKLEGRDVLTGETVKIENGYTIESKPLLLELDAASAPAPESAGAGFHMHGGANWSAVARVGGGHAVN